MAKKKDSKKVDEGGYAKKRESARERSLAQSASGRDIGQIPKVRKPRRRSGSRLDFRRFCLTYFPASFAKPFSADHLKVIRRIEEAVLRGGLFALAMPRGSGKSTLCETACLWALLYGHRRFVVLIGAERDKADSMLESVKTELACNDLLAEDFPEVCFPVARLENVSNRARTQTCCGQPTLLGWTAGKLVLPTIAGSKASGAVVRAAGLTASIRGLKHKRADGTPIRPDLVVIDDPQTDTSARHEAQCDYRERVLSGAVLGMAGPGESIAGIMPCTVIAPGDVADHLLDRQLHPEWNGERTQLLYAWPTHRQLWDQYADLRAESLRSHGDIRLATEFYRSHRARMDEGAVVAWAERFIAGMELSAVQHCMNLWLQDPAAFMAEYQNDPQPTRVDSLVQLTPEGIVTRLNHQPRGMVPGRSSAITAFVDVQKDLLYWMVCAWEPGYTGHVIDYGAWPDQQRGYFTLSDARPTLSHAVGISSLEGSLWEGLTRLVNLLLGRVWQQEAGGTLRIGRLLIDSGWGVTTDLVYRFCLQHPQSSLLLASKGVPITAAKAPLHEWILKPGERRGQEWSIRPPQAGRPRLCLFDANFWKSFVASRLLQPLGERGALTLYGDRPTDHRMLADHICSEARKATEGSGRELEEWVRLPHRPDNHLLDCLVGCAVGASIESVQLSGAGHEFRPAPERTKSWKEIQAEKQTARRRDETTR